MYRLLNCIHITLCPQLPSYFVRGIRQNCLQNTFNSVKTYNKSRVVTSGHTCMWECSTCFASDKVSSSGTSTFSFPSISRIRCTQLHPLPTVKFSNNNFFLMFIDADCCAQLFPINFCCQFRSHPKLWMLTIFVGTKLLKSDEKLTIYTLVDILHFRKRS